MLGRRFNTLFVLLLLMPAMARAERLPSRVFTTADGLSHNIYIGYEARFTHFPIGGLCADCRGERAGAAS